MSKKLLAVLALGAVASMAVGFAACTPSENEPSGGDKVTVSFIDGTDGKTVLDTVEVEKGSTVEEYVPEKDGYEFVDWFATPSMNHEYDFSTPVNNNVSIFAGFTKYVEDTRTFYILGSGTSELLFISDWGRNTLNDSHKFTKTEGKNEYTLTLDLKAGDQFLIARNKECENKRGFGYVENGKLEDGTVVFSGQGGPYDDSTKGSNIVCEYDGNYTLTLYTYPNEDYYDTENATYTEENKEVYNLGLFDKITWVRNGDVENDSVTVVDYYIKGAGITDREDMYNAATQFAKNGNEATLSVYLKANEEFLFTSRNTKIEDGVPSYSTGSVYIKYENIQDDTSKGYVTGKDGGNIIANAAGNYTFTYNISEEVLTVAYEAAEAPAAREYYLDGNFGGHAFGDYQKTPEEFKLVETEAGSGIYKLSGVTFEADDELLIRAYTVGDPLDWVSPRTDYQTPYLKPTDAFAAAAANNINIKCITAGTYDITFNSYSQMITITPAA